MAVIFEQPISVMVFSAELEVFPVLVRLVLVKLKPVSTQLTLVLVLVSAQLKPVSPQLKLALVLLQLQLIPQPFFPCRFFLLLLISWPHDQSLPIHNPNH